MTPALLVLTLASVLANLAFILVVLSMRESLGTLEFFMRAARGLDEPFPPGFLDIDAPLARSAPSGSVASLEKVASAPPGLDGATAIPSRGDRGPETHPSTDPDGLAGGRRLETPSHRLPSASDRKGRA